MAKIIELAQHKEKIAGSHELRSLLRSLGADDELVNFALERHTELVERHKALGTYSFEISLPSSVPEDSRTVLLEQIQAGIGQVKEKLSSENYRLAAELLHTELKLFQYERLSREEY